MQAAEPGNSATSANEQQSPAERGVLEEIPEHDDEREPVVEGKWDAEESIDNDRPGELGGDPGERLRVADPQDDSAEERPHAERYDERVDAEDDHERAVDQTHEGSHQEREHDADVDGDAVRGVQDPDHHLRQR